MAMFIKFLASGLNNMVILFSSLLPKQAKSRKILNLLLRVCSNPREADISYQSLP
jgi:hypothetical protein